MSNIPTLILCDQCGHCYGGDEEGKTEYVSDYIATLESKVEALEAELKALITPEREQLLLDSAAHIETLEAKVEALQKAAKDYIKAEDTGMYVLVSREALQARLNHSHNDTCSTRLIPDNDCSCGHDALAAALTGGEQDAK